MEHDLKGVGKAIVRGISWLLMTAGALIFLFGDRALHEFYRVAFVGAEIESIGLAIALFVIGMILKSAIGDPVGEEKSSEPQD